jgi:hypothetical protein
MGVIRGINHIGMTVPDIEIATNFFKTASVRKLLMIHRHLMTSREAVL